MHRPGVTYLLHHIGIPTDKTLPNERYAAKFGMYTVDDLSGPIPIQWHRFDADSPLAPLLQHRPHIAYKVDNLLAAIEGHVIILGPYEPIDDYHVAVIDNAGVPIELIQTSLPDAEIWDRAQSGRNSLLYTD